MGVEGVKMVTKTVICVICGEDIELKQADHDKPPSGRCPGCGETYYIPGWNNFDMSVRHVSPKEFWKLSQGAASV